MFHRKGFHYFNNRPEGLTKARKLLAKKVVVCLLSSRGR